MEGSESEAVFESLNLNPPLFINETLNTVDDLLDDAFHFYNQEASALFKTDGTARSRLLSEKESPAETFTCQDLLFDPDLDAQLDILRNRLTMVGKESAGLNHKLQALERQSASSDHCAELVSQALQLYGQPSMQDMFQDMLSTMSELHEKMEKLRTRKVENLECIRAKRIKDPNRDLLASNYRKVEDIQEFMADLKRM